MSTRSVPPEATISVPPARQVGRDGLRVCMFVYNSCNTDARVLKEAASLAMAGHQVEIVAVLDKRSPALEERDGFRIVRIDRQPLHYSLLRRSRRVRRWLRLRSAIARRQWPRWQRSFVARRRALMARAERATIRKLDRRQTASPRPHSPARAAVKVQPPREVRSVARPRRTQPL